MPQGALLTSTINDYYYTKYLVKSHNMHDTRYIICMLLKAIRHIYTMSTNILHQWALSIINYPAKVAIADNSQ